MTTSTKVFKVDTNSISFPNGSDTPIISDPDTKEHLLQAVNILQNTDQPVAFPTETVYGLGGSALNTNAIKNIYAAKNRPADNPLILHISSISQLKRKLIPNSDIPDIYKPLIQKFWPGPLTILLPVEKNSCISPATTVGQPSFAVRLPAHTVARALIALSDLPLAAPSANTSTRPSPTLAEHVYDDLNGKIPIILDGGPCDVGVESTVIDGLSNPPILLRPGGVSLEEIKKYGGSQWENIVVAKGKIKDDEIAKTPGMKYKHYSPRTPVVLFKNCGNDIEIVKKFLNSHVSQNTKLVLLATRYFTSQLAEYPNLDIIELGHSPKQISHNLFAQLRRLDNENYKFILIEGIDESHQGLAIMNRLNKAASIVVEPSGAIDPSITVDPSEAVDSTIAVEPSETVEPSRTIEPSITNNS